MITGLDNQKRIRALIFVAVSSWLVSVSAFSAPQGARRPHPTVRGSDLFSTSHDCMACHNGLATPSGEDVSIGVAWRATMMANSSRDPYWQASVRRETIDHPKAADEIEGECAICHMPMSHTAAHAAGRSARVFAHLGREATDAESRLARDSVSCTLCHQITPRNFGSPSLFTGGFVIDTSIPIESRPLFGPFAPDTALQRVMHSATGFQQREGQHIRQSDLCASCHTLYTTARGPNGEALGRFPEQVPFQEWQHSAYAQSASCQSCHRPPSAGAAPIASVLGQPREGTRSHTFIGGNFFVLRMLDRFRAELGTEAPPAEMARSAKATLEHLADAAARLTIDRATIEGDRLVVDLTVQNLAGHKLPTAYPSRRVWIRFLARDARGRTLLSSGALLPSGAISGNANDESASAFEPHYGQITRGDQVQIYESILADAAGTVTTGLIRALRYAKDNRVLPRGFDKATAAADIAVHGEARDDPDFTGGADRVRYVVDLIPASGATGPFSVEAELLYQPIGFRWADNLGPYASKAAEPQRFVRYYTTMASDSAATLARAATTIAR